MASGLSWVMGQFPGLIVPGEHGPRGMWHLLTVVHGAAEGGDKLMDRIARAWGCVVEPHPVSQEDWDTCLSTCKPGHRRRRRDGSTFCPGAGTRRNQRMVDLGAHLCLGWPNGSAWSGTWHCMTRAEAAGIWTVCWPRDGVRLLAESGMRS